MAAKVSETVILRTYPLREADSIVSFFTRDAGKLRGVAKRARKPGNNFGSGLERLSHVRLFYYVREGRDLATLDSCELLGSRFSLASAYELTVALDYIAEVSDQLLPPGEPNEKFFRLLLAVSNYLVEAGSPAVWPVVNYFTVWSVRLTGILPPLHLTEQDAAAAEEMLRTPVAKLAPREWSRTDLSGLRRQLIRAIEDHAERRLVTAQYLETVC